jgi:hypothetical protein
VNDEMRDAAARAVVFQVLEQAAKARKDEAKAELAQLQPGDTVGAQWDGQLLGKATMTTGRTKLVVTDERAFINWVAGHHPTEIISQINPAFVRGLEQRAREYGAPIDTLGELIPGVELQIGDCYVSVRKEKDAPFVVAQLLSGGRVALDGIKELEQ